MSGTIRPALALAIFGVIAGTTLAHADDGNESKKSSYSNENHDSEGSGARTNEAPLPPLGTTPLAAAALGLGTLLVMRRRRGSAA